MSWSLITRQTVRRTVRTREFPGIVAMFALVFVGLGAVSTYFVTSSSAWGPETYVQIPLYISIVLVPMIGLLLGNNVVAGPREDGRLRLVFGQPVSRLSFVVGSYLAKASILVCGLLVGGVTFLGTVYALGGDPAVDVFAGFLALTTALGLAYFGISFAVSSWLRTTDWTTFTTFSAFLVFVLVWRFVPVGLLFVLNGLAFPETEPAWVTHAAALSPSVTYEYLVDGFVLADVAPTSLGGVSPLPTGALLCFWVLGLPGIAYWRLRTTDL